MNTQAIASRVQLCTLTLSAWRATKLNREESNAVNAAHATGNAARVTVRLTESNHLRELGKLHAEAYGAHRGQTMPTIQDGFRLVPAARVFTHGEMLARYQARHDLLVSDFLSEYESERASAPQRLNGLYDGRHWPERSDVATRFGFKTQYLPCPSDGAWSEWLSESAAAAQAELTERLTAALARVVERCGADGKLYGSVFDNLREVLDLVPAFNLSDCPALEAAALRAATPYNSHGDSLGVLTAEALRDSPQARKEAAAAASSILSAFAACKA